MPVLAQEPADAGVASVDAGAKKGKDAKGKADAPPSSSGKAEVDEVEGLDKLNKGLEEIKAELEGGDD